MKSKINAKQNGLFIIRKCSIDFTSICEFGTWFQLRLLMWQLSCDWLMFRHSLWSIWLNSAGRLHQNLLSAACNRRLHENYANLNCNNILHKKNSVTTLPMHLKLHSKLLSIHYFIIIDEFLVIFRDTVHNLSYLDSLNPCKNSMSRPNSFQS